MARRMSSPWLTAKSKQIGLNSNLYRNSEYFFVSLFMHFVNIASCANALWFFNGLVFLVARDFLHRFQGQDICYTSFKLIRCLFSNFRISLPITRLVLPRIRSSAICYEPCRTTNGSDQQTPRR